MRGRPYRFLFLLLAPRAFGAIPEPITLADAVARAKLQSPQTLQGKLTEQSARFSLDESLASRLPHLVFNGAFETSDNNATQLPDANSATLRIEQNISPFSPQWAMKTRWEKELEAAGFTKLESEADVALLVKTSYFAILRDNEEIALLSEVEKEVKRLEQTILPRYSIGGAPPFDFVKVKTALTDLYRNRNLKEAQLATENARLALVMGLTETTPLSLKPIPNLPTLATLEASPKTNPTLEVLESQVEAAHEGLKAARLERYPALTAELEYDYSGNTLGQLSPGWDVGVGVKIPIWTWGEISARIAKASVAVDLAKAKLAIETQQTLTEIEQAKASARAYLLDEGRMKALISETHRAALSSIMRYRQGAAGILEASEALNLWLETLFNERNAYYNYLSTLATLERLSGKNFVNYEQ